jgi:hypothetical protein
VLGVYVGFIDTEMGASPSSGPKTSPHQVAKKTIEGILGTLDSVLADEPAESLWRAVRQDPAKLFAQMQVIWDERSCYPLPGNAPLIG